jgi:hypothetical protein
MRSVLAVLLALLPQSKAELGPKFQKFDRIGVGCTVKTEIQSSNGRDSKHTMELELTAEVEKAEGGTAVFDCGITSLKISGTLDGRPVEGIWRKGSSPDRKIPGVERAIEKGWKLTLSKKGLAVDDAMIEFGDALPIFNPGVLLGLSVPLPFDSVAEGKGWELKNQTYGYFGGFGFKAAASLNVLEKDAARISAKLTYSRPETEIPIEGGANVKGDGYASLEYDVKSGRPVKGASSVKLSLGQGGLKREVSQLIEFEVRR